MSGVRSGEKTSNIGGWKQRERETVLGFFRRKRKVSLIETGDDQQCISISGSDVRQRLSRFGVEREKMES